MKGAHKIPAPGEIRQSQLITTFGPGAMLDLPDHSVVIAGLEHWWGEKRRIHEARLEDRLREQLELPEVALYAPPVDSDTSGRTRVGVKTYVFPAWFVAQEDDASSTYTDPGGRVYRSRPLVHWRRLQQGRFRSETARRLVSVVPVRFVQGCKNGHLSDIDWYAFVHGSFSNPCRLQLYLQEGGTGGDLADIFVRCACGARRVLGLVKMEKAAVLGHCTGQRPWLGKMAAEPCIARGGSGEAEPNRLLVRSASNAYFPQVLSVISLPDRGAALRQAVDELWEDELQHEESEADVARLRKKRPKINARMEGFTDAEVFGEMLRRRGPPAPGPSLKQVEIETLLAAKEDESDDVPEVDFFAQARPLTGLSSAFRARIARVVLVHRLREVTAQLGFTRFEAVTPTIIVAVSGSIRKPIENLRSPEASHV